MIRLASTADAGAVHAIYAPIVRDTAISFEWEVPSVPELATRIEAVLNSRPWLLYERAGEVLGYAYAGGFRDRYAYRWGTEVAVYIRSDARQRGLGRALYTALFEVVRLQGYCYAVAGATVPNPGSERLHECMGFRLVGVFPGAGFKLGSWHDVAFYQRPLRLQPAEPAELRPLSDVIDTDAWHGALEAGALLARKL